MGSDQKLEDYTCKQKTLSLVPHKKQTYVSTF